MNGMEELADAIDRALISPNVLDGNLEPANIVDVVQRLANSTADIAGAITPQGVMAGKDAAGGRVGSLTEAVMGVTAGLCRIAEAIDGLADAVRESS